MKFLDNLSITRKSVFLLISILLSMTITLLSGFYVDSDALYYIQFSLLAISMVLAVNIFKNTSIMIKNLEANISKKTNELQKLNDKLKQKIEEEVNKNREKDKIMYQHSRLASMGEMVGNIAHQWRQPLNAMTVLIQSFGIKNMQGKLTDEFIDAQVEEGIKLANLMSQTIEDFRNFFTPNRTRSYFDLGNTIRNTISILQEHDINFTVRCDEVVSIYGFQNEFSQVILNLLNNSVDKFNTVKTKYDKNILIDVKIDKKSNSVKIQYLDNAGGIREDIIDRIFEPYFTTKHKSTGTGIGLFMSQQIIQKQMNGVILASNITMNFDHNSYKCAKFEITLPLTAKQTQTSQEKLSIA